VALTASSARKEDEWNEREGGRTFSCLYTFFLVSSIRPNGRDASSLCCFIRFAERGRENSAILRRAESSWSGSGGSV
jgi:hypothetical protein